MTLEANLLEKKCFIWKPIEVISTCQVIDSVLFFLLMCKEFFSSDLTEVMPSNRKDQLKFSIQGQIFIIKKKISMEDNAQT